MLARGAIRAGYLALGAFVLLAPGIGQLGGIYTPAIRTWTMYSGVGVGMLRGEFTISRDGEVVAREMPLAFFGLERYPTGDHYWFDRLILKPGDLERVAEQRCAALEEGETLGYAGLVGGMRGWETVEAADLCGGGS